MGGESSERASGESEGEALRVINGEMSEWLKEHAWKACVGETLPWVRIPLSPPKFGLQNQRFAAGSGVPGATWYRVLLRADDLDRRSWSQAGLPEACKQTWLCGVRLSQRTDALCEQGSSSLPFTYIPQVDEQRHRGGVVGGAPGTDMRVNAPPRVTFLLRQVSQVSIAENLRLSIARGTVPSLTLQRCLASSLGDGFCPSTQFTGG